MKECKPDGTQNRPPRRRVLLRGVFVHGRAQMTIPCAILDLSEKGARIRLSSVDPIGEPFLLVDISDAAGYAAEVAWRRGATLGLAFSARFDLQAPEPGAPPILRRIWLDSVRVQKGAD